MKFLVVSICVYGLLIYLNSRKSSAIKKTKSLYKFTMRATKSLSHLGMIGMGFPFVITLVFLFYPNVEGLEHIPIYDVMGRLTKLTEDTAFYLIYIFMFVLSLPLMIAPLKGTWDIIVDGDEITIIKAFIFKRHWKISNISQCRQKIGGMNVYVKGRKKKAFFVDGMTEHYDNFVKRMEKEGIEIIYPKDFEDKSLDEIKEVDQMDD